MENLELPKILMDETNLKILSATTFKPRSARELSYIFAIPLASCYRKIKELEEQGFIKAVSRELTREGKRYSKYQSQVGSVKIAFENGHLRMQLQLAFRQPITIEESAESMMNRVEKPSPILSEGPAPVGPVGAGA
ncbi:MAG TPA: helix-turn-helix domain-containing protein [Candidatus Thermoplasmatota archaeon]